jgi:hypothetical protein
MLPVFLSGKPVHTRLHTPLPPCFAKKSPQNVENKGLLLQKVTKSAQIAENKRVEQRSWLLVMGGKLPTTEGRRYLGTLGR